MKKSTFRRGALSAAVVAGVFASGLGMAGMATAAPNLADDPTFSVDVNSSEVTRLAGNDRISTAIIASQSRTWVDEEGVTNVVIARYDDFADALSAGPLADALDAPILVTNSNVLDTRVENELTRLAGLATGGINVVIVGGTGAISADVAADINEATGATSVRVQGSDRYETSIAVSNATIAAYGETEEGLDTVNVFLATGRDFADAMTAGATAASNGGVVLLTADKVMVDATTDYLAALPNLLPAAVDLGSIVTVGGQAEAAFEDADASFTGSDRYETASMLADEYFGFGENISLVDTENVAIASGWTYADAVVAAGYIANADGPLLLSNPNVLNGFTKSYLEENELAIDRAFVFGGEATLSKSVAAEVRTALSW